MIDTKYQADCHSRVMHEERDYAFIYRALAQAALATAVVLGLAVSCTPKPAHAESPATCAASVRGDVQDWLDLGMKEHEIARMLAKRAYEDDASKISLCFIKWEQSTVGLFASTVYVHGDKKGKGRYNGRFATYTPSTTTWN